MREMTPEEIAVQIVRRERPRAWLETDLRAIIERSEKRGHRLAGHRTDATHDCFEMNCKGLGYEVDRLRTRLIEEYP